MPESVLTILKFCFLALLYLFLFRVVRVVVKEMRAPAPVPLQPAATPAAAPVAAAARPSHPAAEDPDASASSNRRTDRVRPTTSPTN